MSNSLMFTLKKWQLNSIRGSYVRTQIVELPDGRGQEVTVFSGDNCIFLAQYTPLGKIAVHERVFADKPLFSYVLTHETAHKNQWWSFFRIPLAILVALNAPGVIISALDALGQVISNNDWAQFTYFPLGMMAASLLIAAPCAFSWLMEFDADFQAIKIIGLNTFKDLTVDKYQSFKLGLNAVINLLTHPPAGLTVRLWRWFHPNGGLQA
jgi:hypothetical protein